MTQHITQIIYKIVWMSFFLLRNAFNTYLFRLILFFNNVKGWKNVRCLGGLPQLRISKDAHNVVIGKKVVFNNYNDAGWYCRCSIWVRPGASLVIGDYTGFNGALIYCNKQIDIGKHVKIGGGARIMDTDFHPLEFLERRKGNNGTCSLPVKIEDDVFIGANCIILKGVTIGVRSIIAAGAVLTKVVPPDEVWGGNPAKFIKSVL